MPPPRLSLPNAVRSARHGLLAYLIVVAALSAVVEGALLLTGQTVLIQVLMLMPALASVVVRVLRREGFGDVSFRWGGRRTWIAIALGLLFPIVVGAIAYGSAWMLGLADLSISESLTGGSPLGRLAYLLLLNGGLNTLAFLVFSAGEEIGWRGYMLVRLVDGHIPFPELVSGVIWGLWHVPMILAGLYASGPNPVASASVFMVNVVAVSFIFARMRLATGSIWPVIVLHAAWNAIIQSVFDRVISGPEAHLPARGRGFRAAPRGRARSVPRSSTARQPPSEPARAPQLAAAYRQRASAPPSRSLRLPADSS
jgi:uncharacterized protein